MDEKYSIEVNQDSYLNQLIFHSHRYLNMNQKVCFEFAIFIILIP